MNKEETRLKESQAIEEQNRVTGKENFPKLRFQYFLERAKVMRRINLLLRTNKVNIIVANFFLCNNFCENVDQAVSKRTVIWKLQCLACHFELL